jgi:membrane protein YqaA with SNARE-associated domain
MKRIVAWAQGFALAAGGPGLFVIAFIDASFLSLPEINDILVVWMVTRHKERLLYYASMATLGSVAGCFVLYWLAWKGGEAVMRRWFHERHIEKGMATFQRYGLLALLVPAILPPPAPFKIFVLLAGVARVPWRRFALAIGVGRGLRYLVEGWLAVMYGEAAISYVQEHGKEAALVTAVVVLLGGVAYFWWQGRRRNSPGEV